MRYLITITLAVLAVLDVASQVDTSKTDRDSLNDLTNNIPTFTVSADVLEDEIQSQDVSGLLQSSRDVFMNAAGFNFSAARFRVRGLGSENYTVMLNGVPMNEPETGWAIWAIWGGLNDITRYQDSRQGIKESEYTFGGIGGYSNIDMRASTQRKRKQVTYSLTNRTYRHRPIVTYNSGVLESGWSFSVSLSSRMADEGYVDGTSYSAGSYFLSAEKKVNEKHSIGFTGFGANTVQGRSGLAVQEIYDLTGTNYYNPYWGWQTSGGEKVKRNARVRHTHRPTAFLYDTWKPDEKTTVNTTAFFQFGRSGQTNLDWYDAADPRPDYYRYLPSYWEDTDAGFANELTNLWQTSDSMRQLNWDNFYFANGKNLYTVVDANGEAGNNITGNRSKYIVQEYRTDPTWFGINSYMTRTINEKLQISGGVHASKYKSENFKVIEDLLGGDFWVDVDQFAETDFDDPLVAQNDLNNLNNVVRVGDRYGYDYEIHVQRENGWGQVKYTLPKWEFYGGLEVGFTQFWRKGNFQNGRFPENSFGESEKQNFLHYGAKGGVLYKLTGRHYFSVNGAYIEKPPNVRNSFLSPRTRNFVVNGLTNKKILGGDLNYHLRYPRLKARLTAFYTEINDQVWTRSFWHDELRSFVNYSMSGVDHLHMGMEFGFEANVTSTIALSGAFTTGDYLWNSRPTATITADNSSEVLAEDRVVYLKNYKLGGMPQTAANFGVKYNAPKYWFVGANVNWFDDIWLDFNPDRRTEDAVDRYIDSDPQWNEVIDQTRLESDFTVNAFAGKSWRFDRKYYLLVTVNVSNVLNNTSFRTGGYEQLRYDKTEIDKFPPRFGYMYGLTYFGMVRFSF